MLLKDNNPSEAKSLIERQVKKTTPRTASDNTATRASTTDNEPQNQQTAVTTDAAAILTAVDEDEEGVEEAQMPEEFDYHSDGEGGGDD